MPVYKVHFAAIPEDVIEVEADCQWDAENAAIWEWKEGNPPVMTLIELDMNDI